MDQKPSLLISFGGNALNVPNQDHPHQNEEFRIARKSMTGVAELLKKGYDKLIITHGNGPQVGQIFHQQELTKNEFPRKITLDVCVADSQGRIGYILQNVFDNVCRQEGIDKRSFAVITQVIVDENDPAFHRPTKPIGVFYSQNEAEKLNKQQGWNFIEDAGRGYRRVVASPVPLEIVETKVFHEILELGFVAIGAGGGGIPVIKKPNGEIMGVEAVIDKDRTSALLANELKIDQLIILTEVKFAYLNFQTLQSQPIKKTTIKNIESYLEKGEFAEGSMKPKVQAAIEFLKNGGKKAIIANLNNLPAAVEGKTGTHISAE